MKVKPYIKTASGNTELTMDKSVVGLSNVDNTSDEDKPLSSVQRNILQNLMTTISNHTTNKENPHAVTKTQVGLPNVDNVKQYSASNPPPYPVTSIGGYTGAVTASTIQKLARDKFYPVGALYLSVSETSPASLFGGTWEKLTQDAYLKIVTSNAGVVGGRSDHKIQTTNLPSHNHSLAGVLSSSFHTTATSGTTAWGAYGLSNETGSTGGGQAYYPYYYGVYMWKRTA